MSEHILVVDDEESISHLVALILESDDYRVETAADGQQALDSIAQEIPTAIFLDMNMPVLDGWGVARSLRKQNCDVPIVVMTAARDVQKCCQEVGARVCLPKPFDVDGVINAAHLAAPHSGP